MNVHDQVDKKKKSTQKMPTFRKLDEYNETEDWCHYIERVNLFFDANESTDPAKQRSLFLVSVGAKTYKLIRSLVDPDDPKDKSFEALAKLAQEHLMLNLPSSHSVSSSTPALNNQVRQLPCF